MNKRNQYKTLGKNFNDEEIIFNYTNTDVHYNKISNFLLNDIIDKNLSVSKGKDYLMYLYYESDKGMNQFERYVSCRKGCSHCCYIYMDCTAIEAELIRKYVVKNFNTEELDVFKNRIKENLSSIPDYKELLDLKLSHDITRNYSLKKIPCIFLSENNTCMIYDVRPFNCRKLVSFSATDKCSENDNIIKPNMAINNIVEYAVNYLSMNISRYNKLKTPLENTQEYKSIYKSLVYWFNNGFEQISRDI